jgi:hypothetical protein
VIRYNALMDRDHPFRSYYSLPSQPVVLERDADWFIPISNVNIRFVMLGAAILAIVVNVSAPWLSGRLFSPRFVGSWTSLSLACVMFGLKLSELVALGFAFGIGSWHFAYRALYVSTATIMLTSGLLYGLQRLNIPLEVAILMFIASTIVVCLTGCITGLVSWWTKWRLVRGSTDNSQSVDLVSKQFDTRLLFKTMIAVAICVPTLKLCASMTSGLGRAGMFSWIAASVWLCWLAIGVSLYAIVQLIAFLIPRAWGWRIAFCCLAIAGPYLFQWIGSLLVWGSSFTFRMDSEMILVAYSLALGYTFGMSLFFLALRFLGFRLQRQVSCQNQDG